MVVEELEKKDVIANLPGMTKSTQRIEYLQLEYKFMETTYWMSEYVDDYLIKVFLAFYYGFAETVFTITERTATGVVFNTLNVRVLLDEMERK